MWPHAQPTCSAPYPHSQSSPSQFGPGPLLLPGAATAPALHALALGGHALPGLYRVGRTLEQFQGVLPVHAVHVQCAPPQFGHAPPGSAHVVQQQ